MPLSNYFKGEGEKVMAKMKKKYGPKKGEQVFYATVKKNKAKGSKSKRVLGVIAPARMD